MDQESKNADNGQPVSTSVVAHLISSDQFEQQVNNKENDKLSLEWTNIIGTHLHNLNDDRLRQIFSLKSLTLEDLCSLAETCTRFERIAHRVFPKDLTIEIWFNDYDICSRTYSPNRHRPSQAIERIFKQFGSCLSEVSMTNYDGEQTSSLMLSLVTEYCVDSLDSLRIERMEIPAVLTRKLKPIFQRLQILDLVRVSIKGGDETLFAGLNSLIELRARGVKNDNAILDNIFPKLERFTYLGDEFRFDHPLLGFIICHRRLKTLHISIQGGFKMNFQQVSGKRCKYLEELDLDIGHTSASSLQSLKTLKVHQLSCDDFKFIPTMTNLRELHLINCRLPTDSNQFSALAQLTKLHLKVGMSDSLDVAGIVRRLTNLEELTITATGHSGFVLDEEIFSEIDAAVKGRPTVLTLRCKFYFVSKSCDEYRMVRLLPLDD